MPGIPLKIVGKLRSERCCRDTPAVGGQRLQIIARAGDPITVVKLVLVAVTGRHRSFGASSADDIGINENRAALCVPVKKEPQMSGLGRRAPDYINALALRVRSNFLELNKFRDDNRWADRSRFLGKGRYARRAHKR